MTSFIIIALLAAQVAYIPILLVAVYEWDFSKAAPAVVSRRLLWLATASAATAAALPVWALRRVSLTVQEIGSVAVPTITAVLASIPYPLYLAFLAVWCVILFVKEKRIHKPRWTININLFAAFASAFVAAVMMLSLLLLPVFRLQGIL